MAFELPSEAVVPDASQTPAPASDAPAFALPDADVSSGADTLARDKNFDPATFAAQNPDQFDYAYDIHKRQQDLPLLDQVKKIDPVAAGKGAGSGLYHFVRGAGEWAYSLLGKTPYHYLTGNDPALKTDTAERLLGAEMAEQGTKELGQTAGRVYDWYKKGDREHDTDDPEELARLQQEDKDQDEQDRLDDFKTRVANAKTNLSLQSGRPVDTGLVGGGMQLLSGGMVVPSEDYSPEALKAAGAPEANLETARSIGAFANPTNLALAVAPELPGAAFVGGAITKGVGKAFQLPMNALEAGASALGKAGPIGKFAGTAAAVGTGVEAPQIIHAIAAHPAAAAGAVVAGGAAKGLQKLGQAMEAQGGEAMTGAPSALTTRAATARYTGLGDFPAAVGMNVGNAVTRGVSTAVGMAPLNAIQSDGDLQKFVESEAGATLFGGTLGMLHSNRPALVEGLRPALRSEGARTIDGSSELGKKSLDYIQSLPQEAQDRVFETMGALQGANTEDASGNKGASRFYILSGPDYQAEVSKLGGSKADGGGRGYFLDSNGSAVINGEAQGGIDDLAHTIGHEGGHGIAGMLRASGSQGGALWNGLVSTARESLMPDGKPTKEFSSFIDTYNKEFDPTGKTKALDPSDPKSIDEFLAEQSGRIVSGEGLDFALPQSIGDKIRDAAGRFAGKFLGIDTRKVGAQTSALNADEVGAVTGAMRDTLRQVAQLPKTEAPEPAAAATATPAPGAPTPATPAAPGAAPTVIPIPAAGGVDLATVSAALQKLFGTSKADADLMAAGASGNTVEEKIASAAQRKSKAVAAAGTSPAPAATPATPATPAPAAAPAAATGSPAPEPALSGFSTAEAPSAAPAAALATFPEESAGAKPRVRVAKDPETGEWFVRKPTDEPAAAPESAPAAAERPAAPVLTPEDIQGRLEAAETAARTEQAGKRRKNEDTRAAATAQAVKEARIRALLDASTETAADDTHLQRREEHGEEKFTGRLDPDNNPVHAALLDELGVSPGARDNIQALQDNIGKNVFLDYRSASKEVQSEREMGAGIDRTGKQRSKEYKQETVDDRLADTDTGTEHKKAFYPMGFRVNPSTGSVTATGFSPQRFLANAGKLIDFLKTQGHDSGYNGPSDPTLHDDMQGYAQNNANGWKGDGSAPLINGPVKPAEGYEPYSIPANRFDLLNASMANESAKTPKVNRAGSKARAEAAQQFARDNGGFVTPEGETNSLRDFINKSGKFTVTNDAGEVRTGTKEILEPTIESLRVDPELMRGVTPDAPEHEGSLRPTGVVDPSAVTASGIPGGKEAAAGFMPGKSDTASIKSKMKEDGIEPQNPSQVRKVYGLTPFWIAPDGSLYDGHALDNGEAHDISQTHVAVAEKYIAPGEKDAMQAAHDKGWIRANISPADGMIMVNAGKLTRSAKQTLEDLAYKQELEVQDDDGRTIIDKPESPSFMPGKAKGALSNFGEDEPSIKSKDEGSELMPGKEEIDGDHVFHVTTADRLASIAKDGLQVGKKAAIGGASYDGNRKGSVFASSKDGVSFWRSRAEDHIFDQFDDFDKKGIAPVVLRLKSREGMEPDEAGSTDARSDAFKIKENVPADDLEIWDGEKWTPVKDAKVDPSSSFDEDGYFKDDAALSNPRFMPGQGKALESFGDQSKQEDSAPAEYPRIAKDAKVSGLTVRKDVPNRSSIRSSFDNPEVLPGIREIPMSELRGEDSGYASKDDSDRVDKLADQIKASGEINPLIVGMGSDGPYVVEGGHRLEALAKNGATSVPAMVVREKESYAVSKRGDSDTPFFVHREGSDRALSNHASADEAWDAAEARNGGAKFMPGKTEQPDEKNLIAVHNLSTDNLRHAIKVGGIAVPSMAIIRADKSNFDQFGEITLVAHPDLIDPKKSKDAKTFNADVYSPRYPKVTTFLKDGDGTKLNGELQKYRDEVKEPSYSFSTGAVVENIEDHGFARSGSEGLVQYAYAREKGLIEPVAGEDQYDAASRARKAIEAADQTDDVGPWFKDKATGLGIEPVEKIFNGYTNSGNRRYLPHDLDTVVKLMKKELRNGEGFNYGVGSIRSKVAKQFRTIEAIQKSRGDIITKPQMDALKKEIDDEFMALEEKATKGRASQGGLDSFSDDLAAMAEGGAANWKHLREMYPDGVPPEMGEFLQKLKSLPTEYFESKVQRAVQMQEFAGAAVPKGTPDDVLKLLAKRGLSVEEYDKGVPADRQRAVSKLAKDADGMFMPGSAAPSRTWFMRGGKRVYHFRHDSGQFSANPTLANFGSSGNPAKDDEDETKAPLSSFR